MDSIERISPVIPKFKYQLPFLEEREKLFRSITDNCARNNDSSTFTITTCATPSVISKLSDPLLVAFSTAPTPLSSTVGSTNSMNDLLQNSAVNDVRSNAPGGNEDTATKFPEVYKIPLLPNGLIKDIQDGAHNKFGPHCSNRQILIDAVSYDLIENFGLL